MNFDKTKDFEDLKRALQSYQNALSHTSSPVNKRFRSGMALVKSYANAKDWTRAARSAFDTVSLVPLLTPRFLQNEDKQNILIDVVGLASDAVAAALHAGQTAYEAIRILELGRGIITESLTELRADIQDLQKQRPDLAEEYLGLRKQLDTPKPSPRVMLTLDTKLARRWSVCYTQFVKFPTLKAFSQARLKMSYMKLLNLVPSLSST
jgi:hypothetical protein